MKIIKRLTLVVVLGGAFLSFSAPGASATTYYVHHPSDPSYASVWNHHWITVCDQQADGHKAYVRYTLWAGWIDPNEAWLTGYDSYGYYNGQWCHREGTSYGTQINNWVICVQYEGCSGYGKRWPRVTEYGSRRTG